MPVELSVQGADKLQQVAQALKQYGRGDLKKELYAGLNRATKPLRADVKRRGPERLPRRGGLAERVAKTRLSTRRGLGRDPGVRIVAGTNAVKDPGAINRGRLVHPVYGHGPRVVQQVTPGWFTDPMQAGAPQVRDELLQVIDEVARKILLAKSARRSGK